MSKWSKKKIKDFAFTASGGTPSTERKEYWHNGTIPWINSGELSKHDIIKKPTTYITQEALDNSSAKLFPIGTVVIALTGATTGMSAILEIETSTNQSITGIFPSKEHDSKFLLYTLHHNIDKILLHNVGSAQPHINKEIVDNLEFNYPIVPEQYVISKILSTADAVIEKTQAAIAKYKAIKQGMLQDLFTRGIDLNTNKLRPRFEDAPELYKESKLGMIPREWDDDVLGNIISVSSGEGLTQENIKPGIHLIYGGNGINGSHSEYLFEDSKLIIGRVGEYCGNAYITKPFSWVTDNALVVTPLKKVFLMNFWQYYLNFLDLNSLAFVGAQPVITGGLINKVVVKEIPEDEQILIAERLKTIDNKLHIEQTYLQKMQSLKKGLMEDLLSGRKQVKVNEELVTQNMN